MPQVRMKKENDEVITKHYSALRNLGLSNQLANAVKYFLDNQLISNWRSLFRYAGFKRNCFVCTLIIDQIYAAGIFSPEEFEFEISKETHGLHLDFANRVNIYIKSGKIEAKLAAYQEVNDAIAEAVINKGHKFVNLKPHHFNTASNSG